VAGFDLPEMIARCQAACPASVDLLSSDWGEISAMRFDMVFASLVLQHVPTSEIERFATGFARMAPVTYLISRGTTDGGDNTFEIVTRLGLFDFSMCTEVEHDPMTHRLRAVGPASLDEARAAGNARHYEVLLRPRA
jgi:hypothetical protein